jgi:glycosyltransferase involved in cell wall biosynthesis
MKVLFIVDKLSRYAGTGVYAEQMVKQLGMLVDSHELVVLLQQNNWPRELRQKIIEDRPDIVHMLCGRPRMILRVGVALRGYGGTKVVSVHNVPPQEFKIGGLYAWRTAYWWARNLRYFYSRSVFLFALRHYYDALVAVSDPVLGRLDASSRKKAHRVPEGVTYEMSSDKSGCTFRDDIVGEQKGPLILTVGAFIFQKGIHRVLDILPSIISEYPQALYVVAGKTRDPAYYKYIQRLVRLRKLDQYVRLLPDADPAVLAGLYQNYDVYVQPSYEEGFCLTFLEALARKKGSKKPFVAVGGTTGEIPALLAVAGMDDFLFSARSETSFAEKLHLALKAFKNDFYPKIRWQQMIETYSWEQAAKETEKLYEQLVCRTDSHRSDLHDCL